MTTVLPEPERSRVGEDVLLGEGSPAGEEVGPDVGLDLALPGLDTHTEDEREDDDVVLRNKWNFKSSNEYFTNPEQGSGYLLIHCVGELPLQIKNPLLNIRFLL